MRQVAIGDKIINDDSDCFVIAEVGHNHQGNIETAKEIFKKAKEAGADAVKLQKRDNRALFTEEMFNSRYDSNNAYGNTYGEHREALEFGMEEFKILKEYANSLGLIFLSLGGIFATFFYNIHYFSFIY